VHDGASVIEATPGAVFGEIVETAPGPFVGLVGQIIGTGLPGTFDVGYSAFSVRS